MRNSDGRSAAGRDGWGSYVKAARVQLRMSQSELARQLNVDRVTVYRWESKQQRPENPETVAEVARVLRLDVDEALTAAGLRLPTATDVLVNREPPLDPDLAILQRRLADPAVAEAEKNTIRATLRYLADLGERGDHRRAAG